MIKTSKPATSVARVVAVLAAAIAVLPVSVAQAHLQHKYLRSITEVPASCASEPALAGTFNGSDMSLARFGSEVLFTQYRNLAGASSKESWRAGQFEPISGECVGTVPEPEAVQHKHLFNAGLSVGTVAAAMQLYIGNESPRESEVAVFGIGACGTVACASPLGAWTGADTPAGAFTSNGATHTTSTGTLPCQARMTGVAFDDSSSLNDWARGDVAVSVQEEDGAAASCQNLAVIDIMEPQSGGAERYVTQLTAASPSEPFSQDIPEALAFSGFNGDLVVLVRPRSDYAAAAVDVLEPSSLDTYRLADRLAAPGSGYSTAPPESVAVDAVTGDIYVVAGAAAYQFDAEGKYIGKITGTPGEPFRESEPESKEGYYEPASVVVNAAGDVILAVQHKTSGGPFATRLDVFGPNEVVPNVEGEVPSNVRLEGESGLWSAKLNGDVNPENEGPAECWFAWGPTPAFGSVAPCTASVKNGETPVRVHANIGELQPDTTYYYRLQASNKNGTNEGEATQDVQFTTPGPGIAEPWSAEPSSTGIDLHASVNPHGRTAQYLFEYGTAAYAGSESHGQSTAAVSLPTSEQLEAVLTHADGLAPSTLYHYRVVVEAEAEPEAKPGVLERFYGPDRTFRTQSGAAPLVLPDGRVWELVSPVDTHGAEALANNIEAEDGPFSEAAAGGGGLAYAVNVPTEAEPRGMESNMMQVLASRGSSGGWSSTDIGGPICRAVGVKVGGPHEYDFFSEDLTLGVRELEVQGARSKQEEEEGVPPRFCAPVHEGLSEMFPAATGFTPLLRHNATCVQTPATCYEPIVTAASEGGDVPVGTSFEGEGGRLGVGFAGATPDLTHVLVESNFSLSAKPPLYHHAEGGGSALYEWTAGAPPAERLQIVSVLPESEGGEAVSGVFVTSSGLFAAARGGISNDGARVLFMTEPAGQDHEHLYMRDLKTGQTVRVDEAEGGSPAEQPQAVFQAASADGSRIFFTTRARLVGAEAGTNGNGEDLYECRIVTEEAAGKAVEKCDLSDLTAGPATGEAVARVLGVLGASETGEYVYFVAEGVLAEGALAGRPNLYVRHAGVTTLIATLSEGDSHDWGRGSGGFYASTARVSGNGLWVTFMSQASLTGYDNRDAVSGKPDAEVYLYGAQQSRLVCVSCNPSGARPHGIEYQKLADLGKVSGTASPGPEGEELASSGQSAWERAGWVAANVPDWATSIALDEALYQPRYLSNDGRVFFNSSDALVSQDTNGNEDVYQYEPVGSGPATGGCTEAESTFVANAQGCVSLISSGVGQGESAFLDASATGSDVFFLSRAELAAGASASGNAVKVYDAHECSVSAPCSPPPPAVAPPCSTAESCRAAPVPQPGVFGTPASATFSGSGNLRPVAAPAKKASGAKPRRKRVSGKRRRKRALRRCAARYRRHARKRRSCERRVRSRLAKGRHGGVRRRHAKPRQARHGNRGSRRNGR